MQVLSITQFQRYCEENNGAIFIYDSQNTYTRAPYHVSHIGKYPTVITALSPNRICFKNNSATLTFGNVKHILLDQDTLQGISDIISIVCNGTDVRHKIVVDKVFEQ